MLFNLFGSNKKQEFIDGYAQKLADAAVEGEIDADLLEELIDYAREHDLSNKELASAQALACDKAFEELFQNGYLDDDEYDLYKDLIDTCYMLKEDQKYKYTTISKRCNAIYKIQEKGLLPKVDPEFANVDYREGEDLHFAGPAKLMKEESGAEKLSGGVIAKGYHAGAVQHDGFGIRLYLKKLLQRCSIAQVAHALLDLFGNILRGFIARQNQCPALQAPRNKLAADLAAKVTGSTGDKI